MIGDKMREVLKKHNLTNTKAAEMMGISQPRLALWLSGKNEPSQESIKKFCKMFNTTPNYLMDFEEELTDQDRAILNAVKSVAGLQKQTESNPDSSKQVQTHNKERE